LSIYEKITPKFYKFNREFNNTLKTEGGGFIVEQPTEHEHNYIMGHHVGVHYTYYNIVLLL